MRFRAAVRIRVRWWEVKDPGGFPPFWSWALGAPPLRGPALAWPSEWDRRPHP
jgi:hypothetical protein